MCRGRFCCEGYDLFLDICKCLYSVWILGKLGKCLYIDWYILDVKYF